MAHDSKAPGTRQETEASALIVAILLMDVVRNEVLLVAAKEEHAHIVQGRAPQLFLQLGPEVRPEAWALEFCLARRVILTRFRPRGLVHAVHLQVEDALAGRDAGVLRAAQLGHRLQALGKVAVCKDALQVLIVGFLDRRLLVVGLRLQAVQGIAHTVGALGMLRGPAKSKHLLPLFPSPVEDRPAGRRRQIFRSLEVVAVLPVEIRQVHVIEPPLLPTGPFRHSKARLTSNPEAEVICYRALGRIIVRILLKEVLVVGLHNLLRLHLPFGEWLCDERVQEGKVSLHALHGRSEPHFPASPSIQWSLRSTRQHSRLQASHKPVGGAGQRKKGVEAHRLAQEPPLADLVEQAAVIVPSHAPHKVEEELAALRSIHREHLLLKVANGAGQRHIGTKLLQATAAAIAADVPPPAGIHKFYRENCFASCSSARLPPRHPPGLGA